MDRARRRLIPLAVWLGLLPSPLTAQSLEEAAKLLEVGRIDEAVAALRSLGRTAADDDAELAAIAWNNACVLESDRGRYREALADCERALEARRGLADDAAQAGTLNNLGRALLGLGQWDRADESFRAALELNASLGEPRGEVINLLNLGVVADRRARFGEALRLYETALERVDENPDAAWAENQRTVARLNRAALLERIGAHEEALPIYLDLLAATSEADYEAALEANLAVVYRNLGDAEEAEQRLERAASLYQRAGDRAGLANAILNLGLVRHLNLHRPAEGESDLRRALALARQAGDRAEEIQALYYLGGTLLDQQKWAEAEATFTEGARLAGESGSAEGRWSAAEGLGRVAEARGDLRAALDHYTSAMDVLEGVRAELGETPRRAGFFGAQRPVYAAAVRTLVALEELAPDEGEWVRRAVEVVQRAKARDLVEALSSPSTGAQQTAPPTDEETAPDDLAPFAVARPEPTLELFLGAGRWYAWWIDGESVRLEGTGEARALLERVRRVHHALSRGAPPADADLAWLSARLLGSVDLPDRLAVAPDGRLWYLPFDLLPIGNGDGGGRPLVEHASLRYLPSGAVRSRRTSPARTEVTLLGFAPLTAHAADLPAAPGGLPLPALPSSQRELEVAARLLGGRAILFRDAEATEETFRRSVADPGARVLHLASHTVVNEGRRDGVGIVLAPSGDDDGLLVPSEISASPLAVDLAVLSACTTVVGFEDDGLGLATLSGALLAAGADAVLATLWEVDDATTAAFFEQFYYRLARGDTPARALRTTKTTLRADRRWGNPSLWAGFVLIGDAGPLEASSRNGREGRGRLAVALLVAAALLGLAWLGLRRPGGRGGRRAADRPRS